MDYYIFLSFLLPFESFRGERLWIIDLLYLGGNELENKRYRRIIINDVVFKCVLLFKKDGYYEIVDSWSGKTFAIIKKCNVKSMVMDE